MTTFTATYSPDDNKLRLYASSRLDADTYARVRAAGFIWAPKQDLFVAPMWTPSREDLLIELCGEVGDEDTSLVDRAEERAERFDGYSERRGKDAERAHSAVAAIADNIPLGQPILVGHHSERHARKDAERIENGMRRAVKMWETSKYWERRAEGAIGHAKYKELPAVRNRRIKGVEADRRKAERSKTEALELVRLWSADLTIEQARVLAGSRHSFTVAVSEGGIRWGAWDVLRPDDERYKDCPAWTVEMVREKVGRSCARSVERCDRWITHYDNRLAYERAMLAASGWIPPAKPKTKAALPLLNYSGTVSYRNPYRDEVVTQEAVPVTKAQLAAINVDYKGTRVSACGTHRVRTALHVPGQKSMSLCIVYLSDSKQHPRPSAEAVAANAEVEESAALAAAERKRDREIETLAARKEAADAPFRDLKQALRSGVAVQVVSAPQLFPTPRELADRMVELADIEPGMSVLEPSAGTGAILDAIKRAGTSAHVDAVEINPQLARALRLRGHDCACEDFLAAPFVPGRGLTDAPEGWDRIVMNPPFGDGADVRHIEHAVTLLRPGGRLVALCANGPRQRARLKLMAEQSGGWWEDLPEGSFKAAGTNVNVALVVIEAGETDGGK